MGLKSIFKATNYSNFRWRVLDRYFSWFQRRKLRTRDFTILANNCISGSIYHKFRVPYNSPTIWAEIKPKDYLELLSNLEFYLNQPLTFASESNGNGLMHDYPIGLLGGKVVVHFLHDKSPEAALDAWNRRVKRMNLSNMFVVLTDDGDPGFEEQWFEFFDKLPYKHKLFFSSKPRKNCSYAVYVKEYIENPMVFASRARRFERYIDVVKWLNGDSAFKKGCD